MLQLLLWANSFPVPTWSGGQRESSHGSMLALQPHDPPERLRF